MFDDQPMSVVEDLSKQQGVQSWVSRDYASCIDGRMYSLLGAGLNNRLSSLLLREVEVIRRQRRRNTLQDVTIAVTISHVLPNIFDQLITSMLLDMVIDPPDQDLLISQLLHDPILLIGSLQQDDLRVTFECDIAGDVDLE